MQQTIHLNQIWHLYHDSELISFQKWRCHRLRFCGGTCQSLVCRYLSPFFMRSTAQTRRKKLGTSFWDWFIKQIKPTIRVFDKNIFCFRRCKIPCNFNFPRIFLFFHFHLLYALHATTSFKDPHLTPTPMLHVCDWMLQNLSTGTVLVHVITLLLIRVLKRIGM